MAAPQAPVPLEAVSPTPRSKIRARMVASSSAVNQETLVRWGNWGSVSIGGPRSGEVQRLERRGVGDVDRRLGIADDEVLEAKAVGLPPWRSDARPMSTRQVVSERIVGRISPAAVWIENWGASLHPVRRR